MKHPLIFAALSVSVATSVACRPRQHDAPTGATSSAATASPSTASSGAGIPADMVAWIYARPNKTPSLSIGLLNPKPSDCVEVASGVRVTANGIALAVRARGGKKTKVSAPHLEVSVHETCETPSFELTDATALASAASVSVEIVDGSRRISAVVLSPFAPRTWSVDRPEGSTVHAGDTLQITWSPASDVVGAFRLDRTPAPPPSATLMTAKPTSAGSGKSSIVVPSGWAGGGEGKLRASGDLNARVSQCEGALRCAFVVTTELASWRLNVVP